MKKVTEGKILKIDFALVKTSERIQNQKEGRTVFERSDEYARITLESGERFTISGETGRELEKLGVGTPFRFTQENGQILIESL